jgi:hypothetical protein
MSLMTHPISQPSLNISPIWTPMIEVSQKITAPPNLDYVGKFHFNIGTIQVTHLSTHFIFWYSEIFVCLNFILGTC